MKKQIVDRLDAFRAEMKKQGVAAAIIPQTDAHLGEYIASHWQVRRWLSGFTGSAGTLVITATDALLWTDSRYFLQAAEQLEGTGIKLMKDGLPETPSITAWLINTLVKGQTVGVDGLLFSATEIDNLRDTLGRRGLRLDADFAPINAIWTDRPELPGDPVFIHDVKYAGRTAADKIRTVLQQTAQQGAEALLVADLAEIAWVLNIRSSDVSCTPVATAFLYLAPAGSTLFIKEEDDLYRKHEEFHYQKAYEPERVKELLEEAGLKVEAIYDAFTREPVREDSERIYFIARECTK